MDGVRLRLRYFWLALLAVVVLGTVGSAAVEGLSLTDAFYFTIVTIATVGYGDIHPASPAGKLLAILLIVLGVGLFLGVIAHVTEMVLSRREKQTRLYKLDMAIGVFFGEVGTRLIAAFARCDSHLDEVREHLAVAAGWTAQDFARAGQELGKYPYEIGLHKMDLSGWASLLLGRRDLLVALLANPMLLEHESFAELLWAVLHLAEELAYREELNHLPYSDRAHLAGDAQRAYRLLAQQWLGYMRHLQESYPYLFSLAVRTNPFDSDASPIVR